jgi:hypothetical protein
VVPLKTSSAFAVRTEEADAIDRPLFRKKVLVIECPLSPHYHVHHPRRVTSWIAASCCWTSSPIDADADANADATAFAAAA